MVSDFQTWDMPDWADQKVLESGTSHIPVPLSRMFGIPEMEIRDSESPNVTPLPICHSDRKDTPCSLRHSDIGATVLRKCHISESQKLTGVNMRDSRRDVGKDW